MFSAWELPLYADFNSRLRLKKGENGIRDSPENVSRIHNHHRIKVSSRPLDNCNLDFGRLSTGRVLEASREAVLLCMQTGFGLIGARVLERVKSLGGVMT